MAQETHRKLLGEDAGGYQPDQEDPFLFYHRIVKKETLDAATFDAKSQADFMAQLMENLEHVEMCVYMIKALMKEPDFALFDDVKKQTSEKVLRNQAKMNPRLQMMLSAVLSGV